MRAAVTENVEGDPAGKKQALSRLLKLFVQVFDPSRICTVEWALSVNMYYSSPILLAKSNIEKLNFCQVSNVVCDGSRFWVCMVEKVTYSRTLINEQYDSNLPSTRRHVLGAG